MNQIFAIPYWYLVFPFAYLLGSIPFGLLISKIFWGYDVRSLGSGNIGMTNVMRIAGKSAGIATFLLDFSKGSLAVTITAFLLNSETNDWILLSGLLPILGHTRSVWLKFKGGKGVATTLGVWLILDWKLFAGMCFCWILVFAVKKISSLSAILSLLCLPLMAYFLYDFGTYFWTSILISVYIISLHKENIQRILSGKEPKISSQNS